MSLFLWGTAMHMIPVHVLTLSFMACTEHKTSPFLHYSLSLSLFFLLPPPGVILSHLHYSSERIKAASLLSPVIVDPKNVYYLLLHLKPLH